MGFALRAQGKFNKLAQIAKFQQAFTYNTIGFLGKLSGIDEFSWRGTKCVFYQKDSEGPIRETRF